MRLVATLCAAACLHGAAWADRHQDVVPPSERALAQQRKAAGPTENRGIESIATLSLVPLDGELKGAEGRVLRAREITVAPGGVVAVHQHEGRPGVAYILAGEIWEHRNDAAEPILRKAGAISFEKTGITHWWENRSDAQVKALVIDIVPAP